MKGQQKGSRGGDRVEVREKERKGGKVDDATDRRIQTADGRIDGKASRRVELEGERLCGLNSIITRISKISSFEL